MTWKDKLTLWEKDEIQPMVHKDIDRSYAIARIDVGRKFIKHSGIDLKNKKVLDVAVGCGGILCAFAEKGAKCYGLDVNYYFIEISKQRFKGMNLDAKLRYWNGVIIPYDDEYFNFVICTDTLEHVPDWRSFVKEICRVLKKGGHIFFSTERRWFPYFIWKDPHNDKPFVILLPKPMRDFIQSRILGLPILDYHFFSRASEIKKEFKKYGVIMKDFDNIKRENFNKKNFPKWSWHIYNLMFIQLLGEK